MQKYLVYGSLVMCDGADDEREIVYVASEVDAALMKYGHHATDCPITWKGECYCGWPELRNTLGKSVSQENT